MKKIIAFFLATIMLLSLFACGKSAEGNTPAETEGTQEQEIEKVRSYEKDGETFYINNANDDQALHIDHVFVDVHQPDISFTNTLEYGLFVFYSITSEKSNKTSPSVSSITLNGTNKYDDVYGYNHNWIDRDILKGTEYESFISGGTFDPSVTLYGCAQTYVTAYDIDHLESLEISIWGYETINYPINRIVTVDDLSSADLK